MRKDERRPSRRGDTVEPWHYVVIALAILAAIIWAITAAIRSNRR
jgi:hypothetical protein